MIDSVKHEIAVA